MKVCSGSDGVCVVIVMVCVGVCCMIVVVKGVSVSRVCVVCYSTHHRVMSQARDDYEGFFRAHMTEEEKVIVHVETSLSV